MIDTFFTILRKSMVATVFVIFAFAVTYIPQPATDGGYHNVEVAEAGGVFIDPVNLVQNTITAVQAAATFVIQNWIYIKEQVLDGIAWTIAKQILANMTADIVDWINSGFDGSPAFVQDLEGFLLEVGDVAVGEFLQDLGGVGSFLCSPFQFDVQLAVAIQADIDRERRQVRCTLTDIVNNVDDFISGDFRQGGWDGWFAMTQNPNNTPYGAIVTAQSEARSRVLNSQSEEKSILDFGQGFLSFEECNQVPGPNGPVEDCHIVTPGDAIAGQLNKALGAGQDQLVAADEFNEIVGALISRLASSVLSDVGLLGQSGGGGFTRYSRASTFEDDVRASNPTLGSGGGSNAPGGPGLGGSGGTAGQDYVNDSLAAQNNFLVQIDSYIDDLTAFINNGLNDETDRAVAGILRTEAQNLQTRVQNVIDTGTPLQNEYNLLSQEYPTATAARQQQISQRQAAIVQQFGNLNALTQQEFSVYASRWDQLLAQNVGPVGPIGPINPRFPNIQP